MSQIGGRCNFVCLKCTSLGDKLGTKNSNFLHQLYINSESYFYFCSVLFYSVIL